MVLSGRPMVLPGSPQAKPSPLASAFEKGRRIRNGGATGKA